MPSASNMKLGFVQNHFGSSPARSLDGSFRKSNSDFSAHSVSGVSASSKSLPISRKVFKGLKDYRKELVDLELFVQCLEDWVLENSFSDESDPMNMEHSFPPPFEIDELRKLDLALEGVLLQQLWRLPRSLYAPNYTKEDEYLALEDFLHAIVKGVWAKSNTVNDDSVFVLVLDSNYGGVVTLGGDLGKLESTPSNPYQAAAEWIRNHSEICVSSVDKIWNKLGNPNWGDLGTLQMIMAIFYSFVQSNGPPRKSIDYLASGHHLRVQKRRMECGALEKERALVPFQPAGNQGEIAEVEEQEVPSLRRHALCLEIKRGEMLLLDDQQQGPRSFQIQESTRAVLGGYEFVVSSTEADKGVKHFKAAGSVEQILARNNCIWSYSAFGSMHEAESGGRCDHPWCGTPILVTRPVGEPLSSIVARNGPFAAKEAVRCCRDCLAALRNVAMANIQHGDISSENVIRVTDAHGSGVKLNILTSWGRAVLEERDSPGINLQFSSSYALQHGKLCPSSDAESLVYLLFFICGGTMDPQDSIESALQWRERSWTRRSIQTHLGEVSALLKAFADYVDGLCGTPYPVDYDIWLKRLSAAVDGSTDRGKTIEAAIT
ncbi:hypothetical protein NL676_019430 [Syzygium grande]|nr:hypothetical protein NL676_019430 [Syzygium grande]